MPSHFRHNRYGLPGLPGCLTSWARFDASVVVVNGLLGWRPINPGVCYSAISRRPLAQLATLRASPNGPMRRTTHPSLRRRRLKRSHASSRGNGISRSRPRGAGPAILAIAVVFAWCTAWQPAGASELRRTAIVKAVQQAAPAVVYIRGEKTVVQSTGYDLHETARRVNGMGTGLIIDERGYILTNSHVVEGVERIQVTLHNGRAYTAKRIAEDSQDDLAIIKIDAESRLSTIRVGTSRDLLLGEPVIAMGNPYGYEQTITRGVISALHRDVQITDTQVYKDLIQTDASINPGNSGGPLLNIDGELIGVTVAVRAGAQGIGFAIPVDKAMAVAARLVSDHVSREVFHGLTVADLESGTGAFVQRVVPESPLADQIQAGDRIIDVNGRRVDRSLDFGCVLLERRPGDELTITVARNGGGTERIRLPLQEAMQPVALVDDLTWTRLGLRLEAIPADSFRSLTTRYRGGLKVTDVRPASPAARQGIRRGDILLGMHVWETISQENVAYILNRPDFNMLSPLKFYILRGGETLYGHLPVTASQP